MELTINESHRYYMSGKIIGINEGRGIFTIIIGKLNVFTRKNPARSLNGNPQTLNIFTMTIPTLNRLLYRNPVQTLSSTPR